jgi:hypothetical protein
MKFATYDFRGNPRDHYVVDRIDVPKPVLEPTVSHHIVVIDRSGSMWGVMEETKAMVEKVMVAEEFTSSKLLLTLISYSSKGDCTLHFARTPVAEVLDPSKPHVAAIRAIRATCLTSVSGALTEALNHVQSGETTCVSIHTDGYFNDASPGAEAKAVDKWVKAVQTSHPNVYANTIAYGSWSDFKMLDRISQSLSGKTVVAKSVKQVYEALHDTTSLLAGRVLPAIHVPGEDGAFLAFHNLTQKRVNASTTDFAVKGVGPDDETALYRFRKLSESTWKRRKGPAIKVPEDYTPVYVLARSLLAAGRLNEAKFALIATMDSKLIALYYKALAATDLADLAVDLERRIAGDFSDYVALPTPGLGFSGPSVLDVCSVLNGHLNDWTLDLDTFLAGYQRRGIARVDGKWVDEVFVPSDTCLVATDDPRYVHVTGFELSNASASVNMTVVRPARLEKGGASVTRVGGRSLSLSEIRSYTIIGDGEMNAATLPIRVAGKRLYAALTSIKAIPEATFDPEQVHAIPIGEMAACPIGATFAFPDDAVFEHLVELTIERGILMAMLGGSPKADEWTPEQLAELKAHNLSASLNYNPPTTNPYRDLTNAVSAGEVDSRTSYSVTVGDRRMVSLKALYSANEYLARRFSVKVEGADADDLDKEGFLKKPKFTDLRNPKATVAPKQLSARTKLNAIDDLMMPIFDRFITGTGFGGVNVKSDSETLAELLDCVERDIEAVYERTLRPLAMFIGATGLVPDGWTVDVLDAEALKTRFPDIDVEKKQLEGTFLVSGSTIIGVFPEVAYFSTPKGVEAARALEGA